MMYFVHGDEAIFSNLDDNAAHGIAISGNLLNLNTHIAEFVHDVFLTSFYFS